MCPATKLARMLVHMPGCQNAHLCAPTGAQAPKLLPMCLKARPDAKMPSPKESKTTNPINQGTVLYLEASVLVEALPNSVNPKLPISVKSL